MIKLREYTSVFRKPDLLILIVTAMFVLMGITMMYQNYMLIEVQMMYIKAGLWIDTDGDPHIGNPDVTVNMTSNNTWHIRPE